MDLIDENPIKDNKSKKLKSSLIVVIVLIALLAIVAVVLYFYGRKLSKEQFKVYLDGTQNAALSAGLNDIFFIQDGKLYTSIMKIADYVGYKAYNGEYKSYTEDTTNCYVNNTKELVTFSSGSKIIRKYSQLGDSESQAFEIDEEVQVRGNTLYISKDGLQKAFNLVVSFDPNQNVVQITTLPYLTTLYEKSVKNASLTKNTLPEDVVFNNQKALRYNYVVILDPDTKLFGVSNFSTDSNGNQTVTPVITERYKSVEFIEGINDFIVVSDDNKYGIIGSDGITKVKPTYDAIQEIDKDVGLYLVTSNSKQGVINQNGKIIVYQDYDQIGLTSNYDPNVTNKYLLYNNCIPVSANNKWGLIDKNGNQILPLDYDGIGCSSVTNKSNTNGIVLVPDLNAIVVEQDITENGSKIPKYGLVSSEGKFMTNIVADSAYATTLEGRTTYYLNVQNETVDIVNFWYTQKAQDQGANEKQNQVENSADTEGTEQGVQIEDNTATQDITEASQEQPTQETTGVQN